jgi:hypothetical protein
VNKNRIKKAWSGPQPGSCGIANSAMFILAKDRQTAKRYNPLTLTSSGS